MARAVKICPLNNMSNAKQLHTMQIGTHYLNDLMVRAVLFEDKPGDIEEINALVKPLGFVTEDEGEAGWPLIKIGTRNTFESGNYVFIASLALIKGEYLVNSGLKLTTMSKEAFELFFTPIHKQN